MFDINDYANVKIWSEYIIPGIAIVGMVTFVLAGALFMKIKQYIVRKIKNKNKGVL